MAGESCGAVALNLCSRLVACAYNSIASETGTYMTRLVPVILTIFLMLAAGATPLSYAGDTPASQQQTDSTAAASEARRLSADLVDLARQGSRAQVKAETLQKATRRRDLLREIAPTNPRAVLDAALQPAERAALPSQLQALTEEWVNLQGELQVIAIDELGRDRYEARLIQWTSKGPQKTALALTQSPQGAKPGDEVRVTGVALVGSTELVVADEVLLVQSVTAVGSTGPQRTAIILASPPGAGTHPQADKANLASIFFSASNPQSARSFYSEASYGQATIVGERGVEGSAADIYGPYTLSSQPVWIFIKRHFQLLRTRLSTLSGRLWRVPEGPHGTFRALVVHGCSISKRALTDLR